MAFKVVQICGGLGNQMFQYAFAKSLQKHLNTPVLLDITSFGWSNRKMQLELFPIDLPYASAKEIAIAKMQHLPKLVRDALKCVGFDRVSQEIVFEYEPKLLKPSRLTYFFGYFQDPRYFDAISPLIKQTFTLPPPPQKKKKKKEKNPPHPPFILTKKKKGVVRKRRGVFCGVCFELGFFIQKKGIQNCLFFKI
ncbi:hypothetical protein JP0179_13550 [Helicobacter pylori]